MKSCSMYSLCQAFFHSTSVCVIQHRTNAFLFIAVQYCIFRLNYSLFILLLMDIWVIARFSPPLWIILFRTFVYMFFSFFWCINEVSPFPLGLYLGVEYLGNSVCIFVQLSHIVSSYQNGYTNLEWLYQFIPSPALALCLQFWSFL